MGKDAGEGGRRVRRWPEEKEGKDVGRGRRGRRVM